MSGIGGDPSQDGDKPDDEPYSAAQRQREEQWSQQPPSYYRMPTVFGPMPGPRQTHFGEPHEPAPRYTTASITYKSSRACLETFLPAPNESHSYRISSPGTEAYCTFSQTTLTNLAWLGGGNRGTYNHFGLYIHNVSCTVGDASKTETGSFVPILFENRTDPILSGREELGMPKLFSYIDVERSPFDKSHLVFTKWGGEVWAEFELHDLVENAGQTQHTATDVPIDLQGGDGAMLFHRYIPKVGRDFKGQAEVEYPVLVPGYGVEEGQAAVPKRTWHTRDANIHFNPRDWEAFPTLHHIISRLAEIPLLEMVTAKVVEGDGFGSPDLGNARRIG